MLVLIGNELKSRSKRQTQIANASQIPSQNAITKTRPQLQGYMSDIPVPGGLLRKRSKKVPTLTFDNMKFTVQTGAQIQATTYDLASFELLTIPCEI